MKTCEMRTDSSALVDQYQVRFKDDIFRCLKTLCPETVLAAFFSVCDGALPFYSVGSWHSFGELFS